jgi:protein gp37
MASHSSIEWTDTTWNPLTGCTKISPGCNHCYAERMAIRLRAMGQRNYRHGFQLTRHPQLLEWPLHRKKPLRIFVNSMSDLFHHEVAMDFLQAIFDVMRRADWHQFQVLTKRAKRLAALSPHIAWPPNVWVGVSVETARYLYRVDGLRRTAAQGKFLSLEPLLGPLPHLDLTGIDWVIVGGESGPGARLMDPDWVRAIRDHCQQAAVPFFFKQWGGVQKKRAGRLLDGRTWEELPQGPGREL